MFDSTRDQEDFLKRYNISQEKFRRSCLTWENLNQIANDYEKHRNEHEGIVQAYAECMRKCSYVHSLSFRIKDTEHLIAKIIRKNEDYIATGKCITKNNYTDYITDLMGIRLLLLFKEDWSGVHEFLLNQFEKFEEPPFVYIRKGDNTQFYKDKIQIKDERPYRSAHYVIRHENGVCLEIQVRTLSEEAWSEVDHKIRYPYNLSNEMLNMYLEIMNRASGMLDEMGTFVNSYIKRFERISNSGVNSNNEVYNYILDRIKDSPDEQLKSDIEQKIETAEDYQKMIAMSQVLNEILDKF